LFATVLGLALPGCKEASLTDVDIPGGGQELVLDFARFQSEVAEVLTRRGCDDLSCHGGGIRGTFELSPENQKDLAFDFAQACLQVDALQRERSSLLLKPLAEQAGGSPHAGDNPTTTFASVSDTDYQTVLSWILAGELH
jgi:hypothetical protein